MSPLETWPALPLDAWRDTYATLHRASQIVGKIALMRSPLVNHWWEVALRVTPRGLGTYPVPHGDRTFELELDLVDHVLRASTSEGRRAEIPLPAPSVAAFYEETVTRLGELGVDVHIRTRPVEVPDPVPFEDDRTPAIYDRDHVERFRRVLIQADRVTRAFRARFVGKCSPSHFFWGGFDLAHTRFSGRRAPEHPGGIPNVPDYVQREAYSHEVWSGGFWPGDARFHAPAFYAYAYPEPAGFREHRVRPSEAFYSEALGEFLLPYDVVRRSRDPDGMLLAFLQSTYEAAAVCGGWEREALERAPGEADGLWERVRLREVVGV